MTTKALLTARFFRLRETRSAYDAADFLIDELQRSLGRRLDEPAPTEKERAQVAELVDFVDSLSWLS